MSLELIGALMKGLSHMGEGVNDALEGSVPIVVHKLTVRVTGNAKSNRGQLEDVAWQLIFKRVSAARIALGFESEVIHHLEQKVVDVSIVFLANAPTSWFSNVQKDPGLVGGVGQIGAAAFIEPYRTLFSRQDDGTDGVLTEKGDGDANKGMPSADQSRGSYVQELVTAALLGQDTNVPMQTNVQGDLVP
jgi:hypothetical protein